VPTRLVVEPGRNHFTVVEGLKDPSSPITRSLCGID
jgi:arylformamidase